MPFEPESPGTTAELLARFQEGDERAADAIFARYLDRLTRLARSRLSPKLARRTDPEDVVMSAWRSFFLAAGQGKFHINRSGDLWRLLVAMMLRKLAHHARRHQAEKRSIESEANFANEETAWASVVRRDPTPEEAVALAEELEWIMASLDSFGQRVFELRLQGETHAVIAEETERSERTVRRKLAEIRTFLAERFARDAE